MPLPTKAFYLKGPKQPEEEKKAGAGIRKKGRKEGKREEIREGGRKNENERTKSEGKRKKERMKKLLIQRAIMETSSEFCLGSNKIKNFRI